MNNTIIPIDLRYPISNDICNTDVNVTVIWLTFFFLVWLLLQVNSIIIMNAVPGAFEYCGFGSISFHFTGSWFAVVETVFGFRWFCSIKFSDFYRPPISLQLVRHMHIEFGTWFFINFIIIVILTVWIIWNISALRFCFKFQ